VLPLQFLTGQSAHSLGLSGEETYDLPGLAEKLTSALAGGRKIAVVARAAGGKQREFEATIRIDTPQEIAYYKHGGILQYVLRQLLAGSGTS